jgi:conjugative relaxase-like TrwC/TraI family protein
MLSLAKVEGSEAAANYYEQTDDYYGGKIREGTGWWGKGAEVLGLSGPVESRDFCRLLRGRIAEGVEIHRGGSSRRSATDLTFSAPKSVSIQAVIGDDRRLYDAHDRAVTKALEFVEQRLGTYRVTLEGETTSIPSGNILVARFRHELSREKDPQLHTHAVVLNATQRLDGQWRALDSQPLYFENMLLGTLYRAELAREVRALGYGIRMTHLDGRFELAHISDAQVAEFSGRSKQIEAELARRGLTRDTANARQIEEAALATRTRKSAFDAAELSKDWHQRSAAENLDYRQPHILAGGTSSEEERKSLAERAMVFAIAHLTERECIVKHNQILGAALGRAEGIATLEDIEQAMAQAVFKGVLANEGDRYTTDEAQLVEQKILDIEARGRGKLARLIRQPWREGMADAGPDKLSAEQAEAVRRIVGEGNRVIGVQGYAGTGKTRMLARVREIAEAEGWECPGIAPSAAAARELDKSGIEAQTIAAFLARRVTLSDKSLLIMDEAGMVPASDMLSVLKQVEAAGARIVLVGDRKQLQAVNAGMPFRQLQDAGMPTARLVKIRRQLDEELRQAVMHASEGRIHESLKLLKPSIVEISYATERHAQIARDYAELSEMERGKTIIVAGTNAAREAINEQVRTYLNKTGTGMPVLVLRQKDLTTPQRRSSLAYKPGDRVQLLKDYKSLGLGKGEIAEVVSAANGTVTLRGAAGGLHEWRPVDKPHAVVFQSVEREMAVGDKVRITANDYGRNVVNGEFATVAALDPELGWISLAMGDGRLETFSTSRPLHLEHGYCSTVHSAQGATCERILVEASVQSATANQSSYCVAISRAKRQVTIYTDDGSMLPQKLARSAEKTVALELKRPSLALGA